MVTTKEAKFTESDYLLLPEGLRAELLDGMLLKEPAPTFWHQTVVGRIHLQIAALVEPTRVVVSPIDVFVDRYNVLQPDVLVTPEDTVIRLGQARVPIPILVLEVLSPSTASRDRDQKVAIYLGAGIREVWLIDPLAATGEIHTSEGIEYFTKSDPMESAVVKGLVLNLEELLRAGQFCP